MMLAGLGSTEHPLLNQTKQACPALQLVVAEGEMLDLQHKCRISSGSPGTTMLVVWRQYLPSRHSPPG